MSDTPPADAPAPDQPPESPPDTGDTTDWKAETEKWKSQARKHEERAKANAKAVTELDQLKQASMSDLDKAVAQAKAEARAEAIKESSSRLVAAEVRTAAKGRLSDEQVKTLLSGLNLSAFVKDDGEIDEAGISKWVESVTPSTTVFPDLGQGARGTTGAGGDMNRLIRQAAGRT